MGVAVIIYITHAQQKKVGDNRCQIQYSPTIANFTLNFNAGTATQDEVCRPWNWSSKSLNLMG